MARNRRRAPIVRSRPATASYLSDRNYSTLRGACWASFGGRRVDILATLALAR